MMKGDNNPVMQDRSLWYLLSSTGIGGAERRMIKVATHVSSLNLFKTVFLFINDTLWQEYKKDPVLISKIKSSNMQIKTIADYQPVSEWLNSLNKISQKIEFSSLENYTDYLRVREKSWYSALYRVTSRNDMVHCFFGDAAITSSLLLAMRGRRSLIEITSNRHLVRFSYYIKTIVSRFNNANYNNNLFIQCISRTVFENLSGTLGDNFIRKHNLKIDYYNGPFLGRNNTYVDSREKNDTILFGHRFVEAKNPVLFCHAVKKMIENGCLDGWKVKIRGRGGLENEMRSILKPFIDKGTVDISFSYNLERELAKSKIFVSLISTGSYPSQSVFEAMQNGNLIVLADTGETKLHFNHQYIHFAELNIESIQKSLRNAMADAVSGQYAEKSKAMIRFYESFADKEYYLNDILNVYRQ